VFLNCFGCDFRKWCPRGKSITLLKRAVRAAARGHYYADEILCGFNCSSWLSLMEETYSFSRQGFQFNAWPDGGPLMEQEQCVVEILKIILGEKIKDINDGAK